MILGKTSSHSGSQLSYLQNRDTGDDVTELLKIIISKSICNLVVLVGQLCLTLCNLMDCSPPGSSVHKILQARMLEWVAIPFSRGSS